MRKSGYSLGSSLIILENSNFQTQRAEVRDILSFLFNPCDRRKENLSHRYEAANSAVLDSDDVVYSHGISDTPDPERNLSAFPIGSATGDQDD